MEKTKIDRKPLKKSAKHVLKKHFWLLVVACLFASLIGAGSDDILSFIGTRNQKAVSTDSAVSTVPSMNAIGMINAILGDTIDLFENKTAESEAAIRKEGLDILGIIKLPSSKGILSAVVNKLSSGSIYILLFSAILSITKSSSASGIVFIILALLLSIAFVTFVTNVYKSAYMRIFLESRTYKHVPVARFLYFFRVKKYLKATRTMFVTFVFQSLWGLTIIGGLIKHYSYSQVPYIVAENPDINTLEAITLSRRMMNGHKWEMFVLDLTFVPWHFLSLGTFGILDLFFVRPYVAATHTEYYTALRDDYKTRGGEGCDLLNDRYLYETADISLINETYADLIELSKEPLAEPPFSTNKIKTFFAKWFGVVLSYNNDEDRAYRAFQLKKHKLEHFDRILDLKTYPTRLFPIPEHEKNEDVEDLGSTRCYSLTSLIMLFFIICIIGWLWEVTLHLITDGVFVNRGTLHGPWLPIYGAGSVLILVILRRLRTIPWLEFVMAIVLSGVVEYFTHWFLEVTKGAKWWDYTGYLLNINGRVCAEGLLVFGLGGIAVVYLLAPFLDNLFRKIPRWVLIVVCAVLSVLFIADIIYSHFVPNMGAGITDYDEKAANAGNKSTDLIERPVPERKIAYKKNCEG